MKDPSHEFLSSKWVVYWWFMDLGNPSEVVTHYLLIWGIIGYGYRDRSPMINALVCMVIHWTLPTMSHDID